MKYKFINKALFFPDEGILAIGDLHLGYEHMLVKAGYLLPQNQIDNMMKDFEEIISEIKKQRWQLKKIVFLGDIKHYFSYEWKEKYYFNKVIDFLKKHVKDNDIVIVKGNHDKIDIYGKKMKNYYIKNGIAFLHGHMSYPQIFDKNVKTIVMGHLHPSVLLSDKTNTKREKYKCFLVGNYRQKQVFILPSFPEISEGTPINDERFEKENFFIIPFKYISKFKAYVIGDNKKIFDFGEVGKL